MADQKIELEIVLDDGSVKRAFATVKKEADEAGTTFGNAFKINGITDFAVGLYAVNKALSVVKGTANELVNTVLSGEKIDAINKRFEILAQQQNVSASALSQGISRAVDGTVDLEDALQATSQALINLQVGIKDIPALFDIARKSASAFGGDTVSNFERIQNAIISGTTKQLKEIGIFINAADAISKYEKQVGAAAGSLNEAQKQQAILNEILKVSEDRFKNINASITPVDESLKRLKVSYGEVGDTISIFANNTLGMLLTQKLNDARLSLDALNIKLGEWLLGKVPTASENIRVLAFEIEELNKKLLMAQVRGDVDRAQEIMTEIDALKQKQLIEQQIAFQQATKNALDLETSNSNQRTINETIVLTDKLRELRDAWDQYEKKVADSANSMALASQQIGATVKAALVNGISQSMQLMIGNLMKGKAAFSDFGKMVLGLMGQLAIQIGTVLLSTGIGMLSLKFLDPTGAIAAGLGLIALGSILSTLGEGSKGNEGVTANGGGVAFTGNQPLPYSEQGFSPNNQEQRIEPKTVVNFTVQGDILDSELTQNRIVQLLNDAIDTKGAVVRGFA